MSIADYTIVTSSDLSWDGIFELPTVTTVTLPAISGGTRSVSLAIQLGDTDSSLLLSRAVRIVFPGESNKKIGFIASGSTDFTEITSVCPGDSQTLADLMSAGAECKIDIGNDLVVWTKHLTSFATYSEIVTSSG